MAASETLTKIDAKELEFPDTLLVSDIENRVFQSIALQVLSRVEGISLIEGNFIDHLLGRDTIERVRGIHVEQDQKKSTVNLKIELNVKYGVIIPVKAEEIQIALLEQVSRLTALHVGTIHLVFRNIDLHPVEAKVAQESQEMQNMAVLS